MNIFNPAPVNQLFLWNGGPVIHYLFPLCPLFLVYKVCNQHIQGDIVMAELAQGLKYLTVSILIHPVVTVHHLEKNTCGIPKAGIDRLTMAAVLLVDGAADSRVTFFVFVCNLTGVVFRRTVVHNEDLHLITAREQRFDTMPHVSRRVIAGDCN